MQAYIFLVLTGIGIGSLEYARYCSRVVAAGGGEVETEIYIETEQETETKRETDSAAGEQAQEMPARIALTFDDGPHPVYTKQLLDGLRERGVTATFFLIGENIEGNEDLIKQMYEDGHLIGNHTWSHVKLTDMEAKAACEEITKTSALVKEITGKDTEYIRPPFGSWEPDLECGFAMFPVLWSVDTRDWTTKNVEQVVNRAVSGAEDNAIILFHDCYASSVEAALRTVDILQAEGYEFVTADELIFD